MRQESVLRTRGRGEHSGQTLVIALSVMFLLFFVGALFVAMIARNLTRVEYAGNRSSAASLAESGLNWVNTQLTYSELGADWRPSPTWPTKAVTAMENIRLRDPDYFWLSDQGTYDRPWTRIASGDGRFLIRIDYEPGYHSTQQNNPSVFDPISGHLHIEAVGRPGRLDETDPTQVASPNNPEWRPGQILGQYQQLEAWKPLGLTDQLWWITNKNKDRGPAVVGVQPLQDGQGRTVVYTQEFGLPPVSQQTGLPPGQPVANQPSGGGGFRSNVDVLFQGPTKFNLFPLSGEGVYVNGSVQMGMVPHQGGPVQAPVLVSLQSEATGNLVGTMTEGPSDTPRFQYNYPQLQDSHGVFLDNGYLADPSVVPQRSIQYLDPPSIDLAESGNPDNRYLRMTESTGINITLNPAGASRVVNSGDYGWGDGIYVDNFDDIQYPDNRDGVLNEWLQRGPADVSQTGWSGGFYTPSVRESGTVHPILEVELLPNGIQLTRYDRDVKGRNLQPENQYKNRLFYQAYSKQDPNLTGSPPPLSPTDVDPTKGLSPVGQSILMPYPGSGVIYTEGSLRIKGTIGRLPNPGESGGTKPVDLTVVSGGTIYIEGSLVKATPASHLALLAHDNVCLNPTQFTAVRPYEDVTIQPDGPGASSFHYEVPQNKDLDLVFTSSGPITAKGMLLNLQHTAGFSDNSSTTSVSMYVNGLDSGHQYDFSSGAVKPHYPPTGGGQGTGGNPYVFQFFPPPTDPNWWLNSWGVTNFQSSTSSTINYERKSFWIPSGALKTGAGAENVFRFHVDPTPNGQPWWLAGASLVPYQQPLDINVEAVMYAQNGSWFVVPTPWANNNPLDSRQIFMQGDQSQRAQGTRANGTFPADSEDYPFYREPLNVRVTVRGSVTEATTAERADRAQWIKKTTMDFIDPTTNTPVSQELSLPGWYQPNIRYVYDQDLRNWVRYRNVVTGAEGVAYTGTTAAPSGALTLAAVRAAALQGTTPSNIVTLPILPRLPTSGTLFKGRPL